MATAIPAAPNSQVPIVPKRPMISGPAAPSTTTTTSVAVAGIVIVIVVVIVVIVIVVIVVIVLVLVLVLVLVVVVVADGFSCQDFLAGRAILCGQCVLVCVLAIKACSHRCWELPVLIPS